MKQSNNIFTPTLLTWFAQNARDLPWRHIQDPYAIWLSEIILQQTRIAQGTAYWQHFMQRWPTVNDLARASEDEVLRAWQGLGYYSRARNLHHAAQQIVQRGTFPNNYADLRQLKGVGDYTAAAIASMAFHQPHAAVDGNFYRVFARYFGLSQPINTPQGKQLFATMAQDYLPPHQASAYNQAIMDFGATVCTPKAPSCSVCPLQETCTAFREDRVDQLPVKLRTLKVKQRQMDCFYVHCHGQIALHKRAAGDIWQGLWTVPEADHLSASLRQQATLLKSNVKHVLTHRVIHANFYRLECHERPTLPADFIWIDEADIDHYAIPRLMEMLLESLA